MWKIIITICTAFTLFSFAAAAQDAKAEDALIIGEHTRFRGTFCKDIAAVERVFTAPTQNEALLRLESERWCVVMESDLMVIERGKTYHLLTDSGIETWTVAKVKLLIDGSEHYIVTTLDVYVGYEA